MRLPWVSRELVESERAASDRIIAHFQKEVERLAAIVTAQRAELSTLTERLTNPPTPPASDFSTPPRPIDPDGDIVRAAIRDEAQGDPRLMAYLTKRARELRASGTMSAQAVADEIRTWVTVGDPFEAFN